MEGVKNIRNTPHPGQCLVCSRLEYQCALFLLSLCSLLCNILPESGIREGQELLTLATASRGQMTLLVLWYFKN